MTTDSRYKMSQEHLEQLKKELEYLQTVREKEVADLIKEARSFGDLSENSEYDEAKTEQGKLYSKIAELKDLIENAEIVEMTAATGKVGHGSSVRVRSVETGAEITYALVGSQDADPMVGKISSDSPFGRCLMGHGIGDTVTVDAPAGQFRYEVLEIGVGN